MKNQLNEMPVVLKKGDLLIMYGFENHNQLRRAIGEEDWIKLELKKRHILRPAQVRKIMEILGEPLRKYEVML